MDSLNLTEITHWSHVVLAEILSAGDFAVDLTVGNGKDTLFLLEAVGKTGCVVGFDIQEEALLTAKASLEAAGARAEIAGAASVDTPLGVAPGVWLIAGDHSRWAELVEGAPRAIIANLGYLPGGDKGVTTSAPSTLKALQGGLERLAPGGRLAVVCYVGHPGGAEEAALVTGLFATGELRKKFRVLKIGNPNAEGSPFLVVAEKRAG